MCGFDPWVRKILWRRKWQPTLVLLPGKFHGWRSVVGYSPWGRKELDTTERLHFTSKLGKKYVKAVYCHSIYLTYMQSTSCKMQDWMKHKLESRSLGEIAITSDMQVTPSLWKKAKEELKSLFMKVK